jgi:adenylate cyclase
MSRRRRHSVIGVAIAAGSALCAFFLSNVSFFQTVNLKAQDAHFVFRGPRPVKNIVLLTIDKTSLETFPEVQLFWHPYYAEAIKASARARAKVFVLDVAFGIPVNKWEPDHDQMLAEAVVTAAPSMPVICAYVAPMMGKQQDWPVPLNMLASAMGLSAFPNLTIDSDDFVRRQELFGAPDPATGVSAKSMALRAAEKFFGEDAQFRDGKVMLKGRTIPVSPDRTITINYAGEAGTIDRVPLAEFIKHARANDAKQLETWVGGKIVLLGPDSPDDTDRHATPFFTVFDSDTWRTAGVEIHANSLNTILSGDYLIPAPEWLRILCLMAIAGITVYVTAYFRVGRVIAWMMAVVAAVIVGTHLLFLSRTVLSTSELLTAWLIALLGATIYRFATAEKKSAFFRSAVALFVGKQVAKSLEESQHIGLTGKRQMVTILFTDIRGFTAFCEEKDPALVVELLNEYMAQMVSIIHRYHGHVNKFIGDGILAVFCDDDHGSRPGDHGIRAARCAIDMVSAPGEFRTGAGLHSGAVVIGNVGSEEKMEFTVLGDTVNLASRLESMNKEHKTKMLLSEATRELIGDALETVFLGSVAIRGKTLPMKLYTAAQLIEKKEERDAAIVVSEER